MRNSLSEAKSSYRLPLYFFAASLVIQIISYALGTLLQERLPDPRLLLLIHGVLALLLAYWLKLPRVWQLFNLLVWPLTVISIYFEVSSAALSLLVILLFLIYVPTFWTRVPYYPTSREAYDVILAQLPEKGRFQFIDLGCGFGTLLGYLSKRRPSGFFRGVEISPLPYLVSKIRFLVTSKERADVEMKNFFNLSLADYDVVYAFLAPGPMPELWDKVKREMKHGALFLTNTFAVDGAPEKVQEIHDARGCSLYVHRIP